MSRKPAYMNAQHLSQELRRARQAYYAGQPIMSDAAFDAAELELQRIDPTNSYFSEVGAPADGNWPKRSHLIPMGSLNKVQTLDEMRDWCAGFERPWQIVVMDKLDGASIELVYRNGHLKHAVTRGDGLVGEEITRNVRMMKNVPHEVNGFTGQVRGEVVCLKTDFDQHFKNEGYSNPRNTAAGIMKRQDDPEPCRYLSVIVYDVAGIDLSCKLKELSWLIRHGFTVPNSDSVLNADQVAKVYSNYINFRRAELDYDIDGLVLCIDDAYVRSTLGESNMRPKGAIAFKFPHEQKRTVLRTVDWQVGPSGRITPVAKFDSIELGGANVKQASLHNVGYIERLVEHRATSLRMGDVILVSRRNDVIPYVEEFVTSGGGECIVPPLKCPSCHESTCVSCEYLICTNPMCPAQVRGAIKRWIEKLDIKDFGEALIDALCTSGMVSNVADLYVLDEKRVAKLTYSSGRVCGAATAKLALNNLNAKKVLPLEVMVGSLGIPLWGRSMVKILVEAGFDSLDALHRATIDQLSRVPGVERTKALAFKNGFAANWNMLQNMLLVGLSIAQRSEGHLAGTTMCMTGFRDGALAAAFENVGGSIKGSVSKGLTYLVAADPKTSSGKLDKARELGVTVIGRDEMWNIVRNER